MPISVFLADDHPVVRNGLQLILQAEADIKVVGEAADGHDAVRRVEKTRPEKQQDGAINTGIKTIVIDPGHGGKDPGAVGPGGTQEKHIVLGIALQLRDLLKR